MRKDTGQTLLPGTSVKKINGMKVGFIGMTLEATPTLVDPAGVASVDFKDEVETANAQAALLEKQGVKAIVVLLHEGGLQKGTYNECKEASGAVIDIAKQMTPKVDALITGHTHQPYVCSVPDPAGNARLVTSDAVPEITRLKTEDGAPMDLVGATLAAAPMRAGLIDEYAIVTHPVLVGGGTPYFTALDNWVNLNLVETRTFPDGLLLTRYETRR